MGAHEWQSHLPAGIFYCFLSKVDSFAAYVAFAVTFQHLPVGNFFLHPNIKQKKISSVANATAQMNPALNTIEYCSKRMRQLYASYANEFPLWMQR